MQPNPPRWRRTAAVLFTSSALTIALMASASAVESGNVNSTSAQLMSGTDSNATALTTLAKGDALTILDTETADFYHVAYTAANGESTVGYLPTEAVSANTAILHTAVIVGDDVRIRALPDTEADIVAKISSGTQITLLNSGSDGWYQVAYGENVGYIASDFLNTDPLASDISVTMSTSLRNAPSKTAGYVRLLTPNDTFDIIGLADGWYAVDCNGETGYVEASKIDVGTTYLAEQAGIITAEDSVTLRATADADSEALTSLPSGAICTYSASESDGWYSVTFNGQSGYVSAEFVSATDSVTGAYAQITVDATPVMAGAGSIFSQIGELTGGETVSITGVCNGWYQVELSNRVGYICPTDVSFTTEDGYADANYPVDNGSSVVEYAAQFLGNPYVWGGTSLTNGADCSGFVLAVYANFGYSLPHSSTAMRNCGYAVSYSDMQPGDIVCYDHHVGIYAGNGMIINALNASSGITYTDVNYKTIVAIRRIF